MTEVVGVNSHQIIDKESITTIHARHHRKLIPQSLEFYFTVYIISRLGIFLCFASKTTG